MDYRKEYDKWLASSHITDEEKHILQSMTEDEIKEAFYRNAEFGTGGMRGIMGLGTNRINRYTIRMAAKGLADMIRLSAGSDETPGIVIGYDTRNNSGAFAEETAGVFAACGIRAYLFDRCSPVPLVSFAVRRLGCSGGVVITASHNTKEYNGFKSYDETGCQMLPDKTEIIAAAMASMDNPLAIETAPADDPLIEKIGEEIIADFQSEIRGCGSMDREKEYSRNEAAGNLKVVYSPIHGSGRDYVMNALAGAGFTDVSVVQEQADYNGDFPTVSKPNPEDAAALAFATEKALKEGADIVLGTDPDCDRVGVAVIGDEGDVTYLSGNQTGVLLIDYMIRCRGEGCESNPLQMITTIVTSQLGTIVAESHGIIVRHVLTGFKFIGGIMNEMEKQGNSGEFLMGYEESYGYLTGTHARDKDGVSSALAICRMAAYHKANGKKLTDVLEDIYSEAGYWSDSQESLVYEGAAGEETMKKIMAAFRKEKGNLFEGVEEYIDYIDGVGGLPPSDVLKYVFKDSSWIAVRPSGTEPKIKIYYCMKGKDEKSALARRDLVAERVHVLNSHVG